MRACCFRCQRRSERGGGTGDSGRMHWKLPSTGGSPWQRGFSVGSADQGCRDALSCCSTSNDFVGLEREAKLGGDVVVAEFVGTVVAVDAFAAEVVVKALLAESKELRVQSPDSTEVFAQLLLLLVSKKLTRLKRKKKLPTEESLFFRSR